MELLFIACAFVVFLAWAARHLYRLNQECLAEEAAFEAWARPRREAEWEHRVKPAICLNCKHYNRPDRACHRMPQLDRKPADHWCGEFNRTTFVFKEEA